MILREIKEYFEAKQQAIPEVKHFVFGVDEKALRELVAQFSGLYMFVDYGQLSSTTDKENRVSDKMECAVTIAKPLGANQIPPDDVNVIAFTCFEFVAELRRRMYRDFRECPWMKYLSPSHEILPFVAPDIARSVGSTLTFRVEGYDLLGLKDR